jgi:pyruvate dehydrogenase E1 component alpha subunit
MTTATGKKTRKRPIDDLAEADLHRMLYRMMLIRRFEERTMQNYMQQNIGGFCHIYSGQEGVAVGSIAALRADDPVITAYRDHGYPLARGMAPKYAMAELFGKRTGCAKGKGGSMHFFDKSRELYGGHAIVGGQVPLAAGLGFAIQYNKENKVCLCYLGDGALNQGAFHEALNLAAIWRLPVLFVIENNAYSMGTHIARGTSMAHDLGKKAASYGIRYAECDGHDVLNVYDTISAEVAQTRGSSSTALGFDKDYGGPVLVNAITYRYQGHSMSDPRKYRTKEEEEQEAARDVINTMVNYLVNNELSTQEKVDELDEQAKQAAQASVKYAKDSPNPDWDELYTDVYVNPFPPFGPTSLPPFLEEQKNEE